MTALLQALAETTRDPLTAAVAFALSRGADGCDPAELRAFLGGTHPERVTTYLANLQGVLQLNTLGRLLVMPPAQWPLRQIRRMSVPAQLGLPTKDDLVDTIAGRRPQDTPPPAAASPPVVGDTSTFKRFNVPDPKRQTSKRPEELRDKVLAFVGTRDYARHWVQPRNDHLFENQEESETLAGTLRYCIARESECANPIANRGAYLWRMLQEFRRQRVKAAHL